PGPAPWLLAETRPPPRRVYGGMPPFGPKKTSCPTRDGLLQVWPPSVDLIDRTVVSKQSEMGMTTVPLGCTSGWPPITQVSSGVVLGAPQVAPPSVDVLIWTRFARSW